MHGDKYCKDCGKYIGNYMIDDYYGLIPRLYCDECRDKAYQRHDTERHKARRKEQKKINKERKRQLEMLKKENELLRKRIQEMEDGSDG